MSYLTIDYNVLSSSSICVTVVRNVNVDLIVGCLQIRVNVCVMELLDRAVCFLLDRVS